MATELRQIVLRNDTAANWTAENPVLEEGEIGIESNTLEFKISDGINNWNSIGYFHEQGSGNGLDADTVDGIDIPDTIANVLTDHNKTNHDSLNIDADTVDSKHYTDILNAVWPVGSIYIQFPTKNDPGTLGLPGTWTNNSSDFAGNFFRAEGGNASAFESGNQPDKTAVNGLTVNNDTHNHTASSGYQIQSHNHTITVDNGTHNHGLSSGDIETRPINQTIRIWERTS